MELRGSDRSGRPRPVKIDNSEFAIPCDTIIPAIGQDLDIDFISNDLLETKSGNYKIKEGHIYIGGDALRGASTAINAIGDGRKAAAEIMSQARIDFQIDLPAEKSHNKKELLLKKAKRAYAPQLKELSIDDRKNFKLVAETLDQATIQAEADRCLQCDEICNVCTTVCPNFANFGYEINPVHYELQKIKVDMDGTISYPEDGIFTVEQQYQILNIANYCNECGNCTTFCPTKGAPYKEKPHIYVTKSSFNETDEGYFLEKKSDETILLNKDGGKLISLTDKGSSYQYETDLLCVELDKETFRVVTANLKSSSSQQISIRKAAEMSVIMEGARLLEYE
jgi:putative selenate reductase